MTTLGKRKRCELRLGSEEFTTKGAAKAAIQQRINQLDVRASLKDVPDYAFFADLVAQPEAHPEDLCIERYLGNLVLYARYAGQWKRLSWHICLDERLNQAHARAYQAALQAGQQPAKRAVRVRNPAVRRNKLMRQAVADLDPTVQPAVRAAGSVPIATTPFVKLVDLFLAQRPPAPEQPDDPIFLADWRKFYRQALGA